MISYQDILHRTVTTTEYLNLEAEKKHFVKRFWRFFFIFLSLFLASIGVPFLLQLQEWHVWSILLGSLFFITTVIVLGVMYSRFYSKLKITFKQTIIPMLLREFDSRLSYFPNLSMLDAYYESKLYNTRVDRYRAEDTVVATFDKTTFSFGEILTEYKTVSTDSKGRRTEQWHTIFFGVMFKSDFNKHFQAETVIDYDNMERLFGKFGRKFQALNSSRAGKLIQLENPEFEKNFAVYSTDEQECRYILSFSLMERLLSLKTKLNYRFSLSFLQNHLYMAISTRKNLFEPTVFGKILTEKDVQELLTMIDAMTQIIEELNLNTRIWTKE